MSLVHGQEERAQGRDGQFNDGDPVDIHQSVASSLCLSRDSCYNSTQLRQSNPDLIDAHNNSLCLLRSGSDPQLLSFQGISLLLSGLGLYFPDLNLLSWNSSSLLAADVSSVWAVKQPKSYSPLFLNLIH